MPTLKELSDAATPGAWYTVDTPWGDGTWIVAGNPDPHAGTMVCDCEDLNETRPENGPGASDDAAFIAALVTAYRSGQLVRASDAEHYLRLSSQKAETVHRLLKALSLAADRLDTAADRIDAVGTALGVREWANEARAASEAAR